MVIKYFLCFTLAVARTEKSTTMRRQKREEKFSKLVPKTTVEEGVTETVKCHLFSYCIYTISSILLASAKVYGKKLKVKRQQNGTNEPKIKTFDNSPRQAREKYFVAVMISYFYQKAAYFFAEVKQQRDLSPPQSR